MFSLINSPYKSPSLAHLLDKFHGELQVKLLPIRRKMVVIFKIIVSLSETIDHAIIVKDLDLVIHRIL